MSTREEIIRAARQIFIEQGVSKATMAGVARRADVSRQTAYNHFSSVDKLATDVMTEEVIGLLAEAGAEDFSGNATDLVTFILKGTSLIRDNELLTALLRQDPKIFVTYQFQRFGVSQQLIIKFLSEVMDSIADDGSEPKLREGNHLDMAAFVLMVAQAAALSRNAVAPFLSSDDAWKKELTLLLEGYLYA